MEIEIGMQRDKNISLSFEDEDADSDSELEDSEWSILDKTWDSTFVDDKKNQVYKFKVWKCFTTEIDNSYGSFWAPFNLTVLRIVLNMHYFALKNVKGKKIKAHLIGTDVLDYDSNIEGGYDPLKPFE